MTTTAQSVIHKAVIALIDEDSARWTTDELVDYLNDGQMEMLSLRPELFANNSTMTATEGSAQTLPAPGIKLLEVFSTIDANGDHHPVRLVDRATMDSVNPGWRNETPKPTSKNYMFDPRYPIKFDMYPPLVGATTISLSYTIEPTEISKPGAGSTYANVTGNIVVSDDYAGALLSYILHRAYMKDSEEAGNSARAQGYYQHFATLLGATGKGIAESGPGATTPQNP